MCKNKKLMLGIVVSAVIATGAHATWAQTASEGVVPQAASEPMVEEPVFNVLTDKVHTIDARLSSVGSEHYYGFTALRGQDVLLDLKSQQHIKVERHVDGVWTLISDKSIKTLKNLNLGEEIIIKVTHNRDTAFSDGEYSIVFGSYPV